MIDLTKDKKKLEEYTKKWALTIIFLTENHLSELAAIGKYVDNEGKFLQLWEETSFCKACVQNHFLELQGYSSECVSGACSPLGAWRELQILSSEVYDFFKPLTKIEHFKKETFDKIQQFMARLRNVRKKLEQADGKNKAEYIK